MSDEESTEQTEIVRHRDIDVHDRISQIEDRQVWFRQPAMIAALVSICAGAGTTVENLYKRHLEATEHERLEVKSEVVSKTSYSFLMKRIADAENEANLYATIISSVLTPSQRRDVQRQIEEVGLTSLGEGDAPPSPAQTEKTVKASEKVYQVIKSQAERQQPLDLNKLESKFVAEKKELEKSPD